MTLQEEWLPPIMLVNHGGKFLLYTGGRLIKLCHRFAMRLQLLS
jgi:hypothetical protein